MDKKEILNKLQDVLRDVFDDDQLTISYSTTAEDIEEWDSLNHIQVVQSTEKMFGIKFTSYEISSWIDIEEMVDCIYSKLSK